MKVDLKLDVPGEPTVKVFDLDIHHLGEKKRWITLPNSKKKVAVVCHVTNLKKKKTVRICSTVLIKNLLDTEIVVEIHGGKDQASTHLDIQPHKSRSIPIDKIDNEVSFHKDLDNKDKKYKSFLPNDLKKLDGIEVTFGGYYAFLRVKQHKHMSVIVIEPLITIKNCLPFKIKAEVSSKNEKDKKLSKTLLTQETFQIAKFGKD
jgi:hypothetical protein